MVLERAKTLLDGWLAASEGGRGAFLEIWRRLPGSLSLGSLIFGSSPNMAPAPPLYRLSGSLDLAPLFR